MSGPTAVAGALDSWPEVLRLAQRGDNQRALLRALLRQIAAEVGATGVSLSLDVGGADRREVSVGTVPDDAAAAPVEEVAEGELRFFGARTGARPSPATLANLAVSIHALRLGERLKRQSFEVAYRGVELEALYDVGLAISRTINPDDLAEEILLRAVSLLDARRGALYLVDGSDLALDSTFGGDARQRVATEAPEVAALLESREPQGLELLPGTEHLLAVPIEIEGRRHGLLVVGDKESRRGVGPFVGADRRTLALFANQAAIALENAYLHRQALEKERLERETELAADIQRRLLPESVPQVDGLEIAGWNQPARTVGGDYYGLLPRSERKLVAVVGDVTGKGMPAALLVSNLHSALHLLLEQEWVGPVLLERLNRHIHELSTANKFITLFLAEIDGTDGRLRFLNAGHDFPILVRADGGTERLASAGMPIGLFAGAEYQVAEIEMAPGDLLCCYSDGITECESPAEEEFGTDRLVDLLIQRREQPLERVVGAIGEAVLDFAAGAPQGDDQTVILLRRSAERS